MSKQRKGILIVITLILILAVGIAAVFIAGKDATPKVNSSSDTTVSNVSSTVSIEEIEDNNSEPAETESEHEFIKPDETEADKILNKGNVSSQSDTSSTVKNEEPKPTIETPEPSETEVETQTFEESKEELENTIDNYLAKHNIDPKTAGETGEICPNCNKKIWNPDTYGFYIPGMPEEYENSGYCLGTCGISLE